MVNALLIINIVRRYHYANDSNKQQYEYEYNMTRTKPTNARSQLIKQNMLTMNCISPRCSQH